MREGRIFPYDCVITDWPQRLREAVINPHMTSSPGVTNDSLQFITRRQKEMEEEEQ